MNKKTDKNEEVLGAVNDAIEERKAGGADAIGEAESERLSREARGRHTRGEPQAVPVATEPLEPSLDRLKTARNELEATDEGSDLREAREREDKMAAEGAALTHITETAADKKAREAAEKEDAGK